MNERQQRGLVIAAIYRITKKGAAYLVPSESVSGKRYSVILNDMSPACTCEDFKNWGHKCKHIYAAEFFAKRENGEGELSVDMETVAMPKPRPTYKQNWPAYNAAQVNEKEQLQELLVELCRGVQEPERQGRGRRPIPLRDSIFAACFKIYSTVSGRRFMSDLRESHERGHISRMPCYNSISNVLEAESTFDLLKSLVVESARPLAAIESTFAPDSSGFSGSRFDRWYDHKWGRHHIRRSWVKCHIMCGVKTNVITAVEIHGQNANDGVQLPAMLATTAKSFGVKEVVADMAYLMRPNLDAIDALGAVPLIPFKCNSVGTSGGVWGKMYHYFAYNREEFLSRYHQRSNVESTFSMVKAKFGDGVRSKCDVAMKNEVLAKLVCHNICCLIGAMHELGIEPTFWEKQALAV